MAKRKHRPRLGQQDWQTLLSRQSASGLSVAAFCAREGVSAASFYQWRTRLRGVAPCSATPTARPAFIDLGTVGAGTGRFELRLDLGGGVLLQLSRG